MGCDHLNETLIHDLCWVDEHTLILATNSRQVWKYTIDTSDRTCKQEVMDYSFGANDVKCTREGKVYATQYIAGDVKIKIFDLKNGNDGIWEPTIHSNSGSVLIDCNEELIVISNGNYSFVYNKVKSYLYKIKHNDIDLISPYFINMYLTEKSVLYGITNIGHQVVVINLLTNGSYINVDGITEAEGVSGISKGYVYISRQISGNIGVYSDEGAFLFFLPADPPVKGEISVVRTSDGVTYLATASYYDRNAPTAIYRINE